MTDNSAPVVFDANTDPAVTDSAVLTSTEFAPVNSDVTITYADDGSSTIVEAGAPEVTAAPPEPDSGFSASVRRGMSFLKSFVPDDVNQRFDTFRAEQSTSMKPWKTFLGLPNFAASYGFINPKYIPARFMANLKTYLWNYVAVFGITFAVIRFVFASFS